MQYCWVTGGLASIYKSHKSSCNSCFWVRKIRDGLQLILRKKCPTSRSRVSVASSSPASSSEESPDACGYLASPLRFGLPAGSPLPATRLKFYTQELFLHVFANAQTSTYNGRIYQLSSIVPAAVVSLIAARQYLLANFRTLCARCV